MYLCYIELFEIELFLHLTLCKQETVFNQITVCKEKLCSYAKLNCLKLSETNFLCAKKELKLVLKYFLQNVFINHIFDICIKRICP